MVGLNRLSWGLLSTAHINQSVIGPIRTAENSQLVAVASRSLDKAAAYAQKWGIPKYYGSYDDLLADPSIDVIYISLPNSLHAEWAIQAMRMGKHVLCEKPLTTRADDAYKIREVSAQTGKVITEAFMYRHHPQTLRIKEMVDQGDIGNLQLIRGSFCYTINRPDNPRLDPRLGGGSLWDVGCYPVSYARFLTGEEPAEVYGQQITGTTGVEILFAGQLRFPSGVISQFDCSFISPSRSVMEITGDRGRIIIPAPFKPGKKSKILIERDGITRTHIVKGADLYQGEIDDLQNAVLYGKPPLINLTESQANIATIVALYESARNFRPVSIHKITA
jgi:predicted dehydrogenase